MDINIGTIIFSLLGLFLLFNGISTLIKNNKIKNYGTKTFGEIIDFNIKTDRDQESGPQITKYPIIEFKNRKGAIITSELTQSDNKYMVGYKIPIIYLLKQNEYKIVINSKLWLIRFPVGMALVGLIICSIVIIINF